jgi:hypothetical protein
LCSQSRRVSAIRARILATLTRAFARLLLRDRNRGASRGPLRLPVPEAKAPVGRVQVGKGLLEHRGGNLGQPRPLRGGLGCGQPG